MVASLGLSLAACGSTWPGEPPRTTLYHPAVDQVTPAGDVAQAAGLSMRNAAQIAALDDALVDLNTRLGGYGAEPAAEIAALRSEKAALAGEIAGLNDRITALETTIQALSVSLDRVGQSVSANMAQTSKVRELINQNALDTLVLEEGEYDLAVGDDQVYAVHLASYRSRARAQEGWKDLQVRYPALLGGLTARLTPLDLANAGGSYLRLLAGPFEDIPPARAFCDKLRDMDMFCQLSLFSGERLTD